MNPAPQSRSVPVTAERSHDGMTKQAGLLVTVIGALHLGATDDVNLVDVEWDHKPARDGRPEMWRGRVHDVEIWCKEVDPASFDSQITGRLEIKVKEVTQHQGKHGDRDEKSQYLYVNVLPASGADIETGHAYIVRPEKDVRGKHRRKVLPLAFDPETDFHVDRQGEPWQVILVREVTPAA